MRTIYQGTKLNGEKQLIADTVIRNIAKLALELPTKRSQNRTFLQLLAGECYKRDLLVLERIDYSEAGQKREFIAYRGGII